MENILYPIDDKGYIKLIHVVGSDLEIVNDARVSYEKESKEFDDKDLRLLRTLLSGIDEPQHTSPIRGCSIKFQVKCPLFVRNQWWKHHVASSYTEGQDSWNEKSYRYRKLSGDDFYVPQVFPAQSELNKQASDFMNVPLMQGRIQQRYVLSIKDSIRSYNDLINRGVSREIARGVLPTAVYTTFRWTVSLHAFLNFLDLRLGHGAQSEIVKYAEAAKALVQDNFENTFQIWEERKYVIRQAMRLYRQANVQNSL